MKKQTLTGVGLAALIVAGALTPAAAQVRGYSAIDLQPSVRADAYASTGSAARPAYDDRAYDNRYDDRYDDRYDARYDDPYDDDSYYDSAGYDDTYDPYYDDPYSAGYRSAAPPRRGEVYYPREDNTGEVIAAVLVGGLIGYAIAEANDDDHHYHHRRRHHRDYRYDRRRRR